LFPVLADKVAGQGETRFMNCSLISGLALGLLDGNRCLAKPAFFGGGGFASHCLAARESILSVGAAEEWI
jgi:hypothetical protein